MEPQVTALKRISIAPLEEVMQYENIDVVERFMRNWNVSLEDSLDIFNEMKKWLWLCADSAKRKRDGEEVPTLGIAHSMILLDEMWHAFILFTKPYTAFCNEYFGFYIHHGPTTNAEKARVKEELEKNKEAYLEKYEQNLTEQYEYIYERLGEKTLQTWYSEWTDLYTPEYLNELYDKKW